MSLWGSLIWNLRLGKKRCATLTFISYVCITFWHIDDCESPLLWGQTWGENFEFYSKQSQLLNKSVVSELKPQICAALPALPVQYVLVWAQSLALVKRYVKPNDHLISYATERHWSYATELYSTVHAVIHSYILL